MGASNGRVHSPPAGVRGAAFGVAPHDDYSDLGVVEKIRLAHERTLVICLVETVKGHDNVDAIAAVPGVDVCWLGHFDTTNFMGIPAQWEHPRYVAAVQALVAACRRHGKAAGFMPADDDWAHRYRELGFRMMAYGADTMLLQHALAGGLRKLRQD